jgi:hypothetical protein
MMSRYFMIQSWVGSHENEPDYNGQQCGERNVRSTEVVPLYDQYGNANVAAFSDEAIAQRRGKDQKKTSVPLVDRILPQQRRVRTLTEQLVELEAERKAGMDIHTYSKLRDILIVKRDRAEELLKKATSVRPVREEIEEVGVETAYETCDVDYTHTEVATPCGVSWIDDLSSENSLKNILKKACVVARTLVRYTQAIKRYIKTLQEV